MIKIELPYNFNFDGKYFLLLDSYNKYFHEIECVYFPAFENKVLNTRKYEINYPITEEDYLSHITEFLKRNIPISILMLKNASIELIDKYYTKYGIKDFTINDNFLAKDIKEKYSDVYLRLSITAKILPDMLYKEEFSAYDNIVLFFWYNKHLDVIKNLPKNFSYTILANTTCLWNCVHCDQHWFGTLNNFNCYKKRFYLEILNFLNTAYIRPSDVYLFEEFASVIKLLGREYNSDLIFKDFNNYINRKDSKILFKFNPRNIESNYNIEL